jgi:hypothetical protein
MKDKTNKLIVILLGALIILTIYRGRFITVFVPVNDSKQFVSGWKLETEFEVYSNGAIGIYPRLSTVDDCGRIDTFHISLQEVGGGLLESLNANDQSKTGGRICADRPASFGMIFNAPNGQIDSLVARFYWVDSAEVTSQTQIGLVKNTRFSLGDYEKSPDILILLYPILWIAFGVLILAKVTKLIKD